MASNVNIQGSTDCAVQAAAGTLTAGTHRKKVIVAGGASGGNATLGSSGVVIAIPANTFLDIGPFQGAVLTTSTARTVVLS